MKLLKNNKGFTLVELIVVIVILGVLAGVGAPQIFKYVKNSRVESMKSNCAMVESVVNNLYAEDGNFRKAFNNTNPYASGTASSPSTATSVIDAAMQNNKTLASMNLTVFSVNETTKQIVLQVNQALAGLDGDEFGTVAPWSIVPTSTPQYTINIAD